MAIKSFAVAQFFISAGHTGVGCYKDRAIHGLGLRKEGRQRSSHWWCSWCRLRFMNNFLFSVLLQFPNAILREFVFKYRTKSPSLNYSSLLRFPGISQNWKHYDNSEWSQDVDQTLQVLPAFSAECILLLHPACNYGVFWLWSCSPLICTLLHGKLNLV